MSNSVLEAVHADPWSEDVVDLQSLNAAASEAIEACIAKVRTFGRAEPRALRSTSLVVLGPPGAGKTHLFARLRRRLGPRAVFVHVRPLVHAPMTPRFVLGEVVKQLGYATQKLVQLDALVGSLLAYLSGAGSSFPSAFLSEYQQLSDDEREARLDEAVEQVLGIWQDVDESYLRRLLAAPFTKGATQRAMLGWLSGRDCDVAQLARIGATASLSEELAIPALRTLCSVAALGAPIVLVLDQLENLIEGTEPGSRLLGYANLAAELVDSLRGLVLVHMALDTEWARGIEPSLNLSQRSRIVMETRTLALPTPHEADALLRLWMDRIPERAAPYPWPFTEAQLSRVVTAPGTTPRMLLVECRRALENPGAAEVETAEAVEPAGSTEEPTPTAGEPTNPTRGFVDAWERCLTAARQAADEAHEQRACLDAGRLADGILCCAKFLKDVRISPGLAGQPAQLVLEIRDGKWLLSVLGQGHPKSLGATLSKLTTLAARIPVIALRERTRDLSPTWKDTLAKRDALLATGQSEWLWIEADDAVRLLALDALLQSARSGDVTNERGEPVGVAQVIEWASGVLGVPSWPIVQALLGGADAKDEAVFELQAKDVRNALPALTLPEPLEPARSGVAVTVLRQLRIASLERVVREAARIQPEATRAAVLAELQSNPHIRFFGRNIVCVRADG